MFIVTRIKNIIREIWLSFKGETWEFRYSTTPDNLGDWKPKSPKCTCGLNQPPSIDHDTKCESYDPNWIVPKNRTE